MVSIKAIPFLLHPTNKITTVLDSSDSLLYQISMSFKWACDHYSVMCPRGHPLGHYYFFICDIDDVGLVLLHSNFHSLIKEANCLTV